MSCIFCEIVSGNIPSKKLYEDDYILAFYDITPMSKVHFLVVPKGHIESADVIDECTAELVKKIFTIIPKLAKEAGIDNGYRIITNVGKDGGQTINHLHFHILGGQKLNTNLS